MATSVVTRATCGKVGARACRSGLPAGVGTGLYGPCVTSAARHAAIHQFGSLVPVPVLREVELAFDQAPGLAELAERADAHEMVRLVREAAPADSPPPDVPDPAPHEARSRTAMAPYQALT